MPDKLLPNSVPYQETRYVFHLSVPRAELKSIAKCVWSYHYQCSPHKRQAFGANNFLATMMLQQAGCGVCQGLHNYHSLILIKPAMVLVDLAGQLQYQRALKLAVKNDEWLVLPNDMMEQGHFRQTRIYVSDFWKADLYIKKGEPIRSPDKYRLT
jgi:hypothetical protein